MLIMTHRLWLHTFFYTILCLVINFNEKNTDCELIKVFKKISIPINIKIDESIITIKSEFNLNDVYYGICLTYWKTEPDAEINKTVDLMIQTIDKYIVIKED